MGSDTDRRWRREASGSTPARLAWMTLAAAFTVLLAGAQVNARQAALSVATWPLSYGHLLLPDWVGNTFYEQLHRLSVGVATLLYLLLAWSVARQSDRRAKRLVLVGLAALMAQVLLGGVVVLWLDPPLVAALHLLLAVAVVAITACVAIRTAGIDTPPLAEDPAAADRNRRRARRLFVLIVVQLALGALSRHPPFGQTVSITTLLAHALAGLLIAVLALVLGASISRRADAGGLRTAGGALELLAALQLGLGLWVFVIAPQPVDPPWPPPDRFPLAHILHVAIGTLLMLLVLFLARKKRRGRRRGSTPASEFRGTPS